MGGPEVPEGLVSFVQAVTVHLINPLIYLLMAAALVLFLWGAVQLVAQADNPEARKRGRTHLLWGLFGLFVMTSVYLILSFGLAAVGVQRGTDFPEEIPLQ